jgi:hypothetical protein
MISDDPAFPTLSREPALPKSNNWRARSKAQKVLITEKNTAIPGVPALRSIGFILIHSRAPPIFTSVVMASAMGGQLRNADKAKQAQNAQGQGPSGHVKPGRSTALTGFTDIVVTHHGGADDVEEENVFHQKNPMDIVQAVQQALNKASHNPPLSSSGVGGLNRW